MPDRTRTRSSLLGRGRGRGRGRWRLARVPYLVLALLAAAAIVGLLRSTILIPGRPLVFQLLGHEIEILAPGWLYLLCSIPYLWLVLCYSLSDLSRVQLALAAFARSLVFLAIITALAQPSIALEDKKTSVVILVDVSKSVTDRQLAAAQEYVNTVFRARSRPGESPGVSPNEARVVAFAARPRVLALDAQGEAPILRRSAGEKDATETDIQAAMQLAYGLFAPGYLPSIVILSDGNETTGSLLAEAYRARDLGIPVSWRSLPANESREIRVAALNLPNEARAGEPFQVTADVWSTHEEETVVALRQDGLPNRLEPLKRVLLHEGSNRVAFRTEAVSAGFTSYQVALRGLKEDTEPANNEASSTLRVRGRPRVLYVEGERDRRPVAASYLARALEAEQIEVEVRGSQGIPRSAKELVHYDLLLLSDLASAFLGPVQVRAIKEYVRDHGGGLIVAGGEDSFGGGDYQGTQIERLLPVRLEGKKDIEQAQVALVLAIDRSGSMAGEKIDMAKESARATAEVLESSDLIGVIAFDTHPTTVVRLQRASNRLRISSDISRLQPGGGTNILPALQEALAVLASAKAKVKHVIVLSDGQAPSEGIAELCDEMRANRITVSTVGIADADRALLSVIAQHGEGRMYMTENAHELPRIFTKETREVQRSSLVEDAIAVRVAKQVEMIEGTGVERAPDLRGYVSTKAKPTAEVILVSERDGEPLLARWRQGTGQVVAWTSDVKNRWAVDWLGWQGFPKFWAQVVRASMRHQQHDSYDLYTSIEDSQIRVVVDAVSSDDRFVNGLDATLELVDPETLRTRRTVAMDQTAAGQYEALLPLERHGAWILRAIHRREGRVVAESVGTAGLPYPAEYLRSSPHLEPLRQAGTITGGLAEPSPEALFAQHKKPIRYHRPIWPFHLLAASALLVLDVFLRRIRLFGYRRV
ncbi:MAG: VWA domain-containing protein [Pseudomonadota bacterium]